MKLNLTIRQAILLLLALFGLIIGGATFFIVRYVTNMCIEKEYLDDRDDLIILASQIEKSMDENDGDPFRFVEATAVVQAKDENFSFMVRDSTGIVVSPAFMAGKEIPISGFRACSEDGYAGMAQVWGYDCFVIFYPLSHHPYELVAVYGYEYVFGDNDKELRLFAFQVLGLLLLVALLTWFWIIPAIERMNDRRNRAEQELHVAYNLQQQAVTHQFPSDVRVDAYALLRAMKEVGGDFYACEQAGDKLHFVVGDVSDKGTAAAFMMFLVSSVIKSRFKRGVSLPAMMSEVNRLLYDLQEYEMFCTLILGTIDLETLEMEYCNAGHTKTILNGDFLDQDPQVIVGITKDYTYRSQHIQLHHGDSLLLYTDGVTEARNPERAFFGAQRLLDWKRAQPERLSSSEICERLLDTLAQYRGKAQQNDDIAIMSIKIR